MHLAHQASIPPHFPQVSEEVPAVDLVDSVEMPILLVVLVVVIALHPTNHQTTADQAEVLVSMLLLPHSTVLTRTKMVVLIPMNSNNSIKVVYKLHFSLLLLHFPL